MIDQRKVSTGATVRRFRVLDSAALSGSKCMETRALPCPLSADFRAGFAAGAAAAREMAATEEAERLRVENDTLRGLLARGDKDCPYCGLPAADIAKCRSGFPGCARMDDIMVADAARAALPPEPATDAR